VCESAAAAVSVSIVESIGQEQYNNFREIVLDSNDTFLTAPIKRNNLLLFHGKQTQNKTAIKQKTHHFTHHTEFYGQDFVALDSRGCIVIRRVTKLLHQFITVGIHHGGVDLFTPGFYDFIIIDGAVLIDSLPGKTVQGKTFYS